MMHEGRRLGLNSIRSSMITFDPDVTSDLSFRHTVKRFALIALRLRTIYYVDTSCFLVHASQRKCWMFTGLLTV